MWSNSCRGLARAPLPCVRTLMTAEAHHGVPFGAARGEKPDDGVGVVAVKHDVLVARAVHPSVNGRRLTGSRFAAIKDFAMTRERCETGGSDSLHRPGAIRPRVSIRARLQVGAVVAHIHGMAICGSTQGI